MRLALAWTLLAAGALAQLLLDGQTFSHALFGLLCAAAVLAIGRSLDHRPLTALGIILGLLCASLLPATYHEQRRFNQNLQRILQKQQDAANAPRPAIEPPTPPDGNPSRSPT